MEFHRKPIGQAAGDQLVGFTVTIADEDVCHNAVPLAAPL
jgi:hypothetical protein